MLAVLIRQPVVAGFHDASGHKRSSNIGRTWRFWDGDVQQAPELEIYSRKQTTLPLLSAVRVVALFQELGNPMHNLISDLCVSDYFRSQDDAKNADGIGTERRRQFINHNTAARLPTQSFLQTLGLIRRENASICAETQNGHGLEILLRPLPRGRVANKRSEFRIPAGVTP
jgi:hypothetical protein